jgi:hypothetical protein
MFGKITLAFRGGIEMPTVSLDSPMFFWFSMDV